MAARYTVREEAANVATHVAGLLASVVGVGVLIYLGVVRDEVLHVASAGVYGATLVALYAASTLYHAFRRPGVKRVLRVLDLNDVLQQQRGQEAQVEQCAGPDGEAEAPVPFRADLQRVQARQPGEHGDGAREGCEQEG